MIDVASGSFILIFIILTQSSDFLTLYYSIRKISLTKNVVSIHVMAINEFSKKYLIEVKLNLPLLSLIMYTNHYKIQYTIVCFKSIGERLQGLGTR